ncbi:LysM peptidoglycan-binding domain-containing protein, partial [Subtercola vilae]
PAPTTDPPPPLTPPNAMGGQTDGGNTANTPLVDDTGPQQYAVGSSSKVSDDEYRYTVAQNDQILAIASRFQLQVADVARVNFPCSDPALMQPGDVLDIRWPLPSEQVGPQNLYPNPRC